MEANQASQELQDPTADGRGREVILPVYPSDDGSNLEGVTSVRILSGFLMSLRNRVLRAFPETFILVGNAGLEGSVGDTYVVVQGEFAERVRQLLAGEEIEVSALSQGQYDCLTRNKENVVAGGGGVA